MWGSDHANLPSHRFLKVNLKLGIIRTSSIGDVVLASACLTLLRELGITSQVVWVGRSPSLELLESSYPEVNFVNIDLVIAEDEEGGLRGLVRRLSHLDLMVDLQNNLRSKLICRRLNKDFNIPFYVSPKKHLDRSRMVITSRFRRRDQGLPREILKPKFRQVNLMLEGLLRGLKNHLPDTEYDGIRHFRARPALSVGSAQFKGTWVREMKFGQWIAIAPGAAYPTKQAPLAVLLDILRKLKDKLQIYSEGEPVGLVILGAESERSVALRLFDEVRWPHSVLNLVGKLSLHESTAVLEKSQVVITNDSGLAHVAEAIGRPVAILFGPTVEGFGFTPWRPNSHAFSADIGCRPCSKHGKAPCRYQDHLCFYKINTNFVVDFVSSKISTSSGGV